MIENPTGVGASQGVGIKVPDALKEWELRRCDRSVCRGVQVQRSRAWTGV
jgi:hypothetical protein